MNFRGAGATIRPVLQHVAAQGFTVEQAPGSGHWKVSNPKTGAFLCALPHTPSSRHAAPRANSVLRRAGVVPLPTHGKRPSDRPILQRKYRAPKSWRAVCWCGWQAEAACADQETAYRAGEQHVAGLPPACDETEAWIRCDDVDPYPA
jgi:hypothetical protein